MLSCTGSLDKSYSITSFPYQKKKNSIRITQGNNKKAKVKRKETGKMFYNI